MLNPFPIQFLALFAYFILRLFIAGVLIFLGLEHLRYRHELKEVLVLSWWPYGTFTSLTFALGEIVVGLFILTGAHTQYAALAVMALSLKLIVLRPWFSHQTIPPRIFYVLLFGACLTLFITGAGILAIDLPF